MSLELVVWRLFLDSDSSISGLEGRPPTDSYVWLWCEPSSLAVSLDVGGLLTGSGFDLAKRDWLTGGCTCCLEGLILYSPLRCVSRSKVRVVTKIDWFQFLGDR